MCPSIGAYTNHALFHSFITSKQPQEICALQLNLSDFSYELNAKMLDTYPDSSESITLFWSPWGSKDSGCSKIKIAKVKACCYSTFTLAIYCFMDFATNVKKKKKKRPILLK